MNRMRCLCAIPILIPFFALMSQTDRAVGFQKSKKPNIELSKSDKKVTVKIDDELFTEYDFGNYKKPIFYPLNINSNVGLTRNHPMKKVKGEQPDHPHHKSVWFSHQINGIMFWGETGDVKHKKFVDYSPEAKAPTFTTQSEWIHKGKTHLTDETKVTFYAGEGWRAMDFEFTWKATHGDVLINDTKEGTFAVRVHPALRAKAHKASGIAGDGRMVNSNGQTGAGIWGKPAVWVDYYGKIDGKVYGVAIFDHPENLRHPTTWHARDYGLLAANPFGIHYFKGKEKGAGEIRIKDGESLTLKYRLVIHEGDHEQAKIGKMYEKYAGKGNQIERKR